MDRDFKGVWIPSELWLNSDLKVMEKIFLAEISSLDGEYGCYASNSYFSNFFDLSKTRCSAIIKSLKDKGYITIRRFYEESNRYLERRVIRVNESSIKNNSNRNIGKISTGIMIKESEGNVEIEDNKQKKSEKNKENLEVNEDIEVVINNNVEDMDDVEVAEVVKVKQEIEVNQEVKVIGDTKEVKREKNNGRVNKDKVKLTEIIEKETGNPMYVDVINYLNEKCKTSYKHTTTKSQRLINARVKEGYELEDFKNVINKKYRAWSGTTMGKYLRPETLFGTKFEGYINEIKIELNGGGQANVWSFGDDENNRENQDSREIEKSSRWSQGENTNNRSLTDEEREWAKRELL